MRSFALAIATLLLLSSCTDDPGPIEPSATGTDPDVAAPTLPDTAESKSSKGQIAFVRHVVSMLNFAVGSGSADELEELFDPACEACEKYVARVRSDNAENGDVEGFNWSVSKGRVLDGDLVEVSIEADPYEKKDPQTGDSTHVRAATYQLGFKLESRHDRWIVSDLYVPEDANE